MAGDGWRVKPIEHLGDQTRLHLTLGPHALITLTEPHTSLKPGGTLIFKWTATENPVSEILKLTPMKPLYGHKSGKQAQTHWIAFLKPEDTSRQDAEESDLL